MTVGKPDTLTFKWLTGILVTIVFTLVGFWARDLTAQVKEVGAQVNIVSVKVSNVEGKLPQIEARLKRIEDNQDADIMIYKRGK
jgi:hypothetical protein